MFLYKLARKANAQLKKYKKQQNGKLLSPVRRIEFVHPPAQGRYVAMTFDDGPSALPPSHSQGDRGLTDTLLDILKEYGAAGTFDVIGDTSQNYPDKPGNPGDFTWSGVHYDHYPQYEMDHLAGAMNQPDLVRRILAEGHEISNHGYTHRLFGPMRAVYGERHHFQSLEEVVADLQKLHHYLEQDFGYTMKLSRPPHYIDNIPKGGSSYDAYRVMGYHYMAASFDGDGWMPNPTYEEDVQKMIDPLRRALEEDINALNGKIIFQKDGCNMMLRTPVADGLGKQLELLKQAGYQVIPVSQLMALSPFEDLDPESPCFPYVQQLLRKGKVIGYKNNTFHGERPTTADECYLMLCDPALLRQPKPMGYADFVRIARESQPSLQLPSRKLGNALLNLAMKQGIDVTEQGLKDVDRPLRRDVMEILAKLSQKEGAL